ncbi:uncharacterized protein UV8b_08018 [Ustilaginoidea virens]|uniref:ABC transporter domain-containing protein n=1 Tax=Ustilaginoidea virens TaxID=1159556 RepID=A0A8E5ML18_USTVR|nr:uncharacterized protein UV8b_08018 [Ustilaginoidea virens]QUC23777.1 hypothetical protein UV8b_08018 [Ustilaginoidea virens]
MADDETFGPDGTEPTDHGSRDSCSTARNRGSSEKDAVLARTAVCVEQAEADFAQLQRELTRVSRTGRGESTTKDVDAEKGVTEDSAHFSANSSFDLEAALRGNLAAAGEAAGIRAKRIGACWDGLTVRGVGGRANHAKTFWNACIDFFDIVTPMAGFLGLGKRPQEAILLDNFQGVCKPGEMVLVLGKPGSGCTTFLKVIANQRYGYSSVEGEVFYGPWTAKEFNRYRAEAVYSAEDDIHHPTLTVEQTLGFALDTKMPARRPGNMAKGEFKERAISLLLKMFNIEHTRKTIVGNHFIRGVSGGERKRVSIAEMMTTDACLFSWDNSTRGLDAITALDFARSLRIQANLYKTTTFASLYQASEDMYNLFDKVMVIDEGRQVFFGPAKEARSYFEGLGFASQPRQSTPDYLTGCTDEFERRYAPGRSEKDAPHDSSTLLEAFANSSYKAKLEREVAEYKARFEQDKHEHDGFQAAVEESKRATSRKSVYQVGFHLQVWALMKRQLILKLQDRFALTLEWASIVIVGIVMGTLYSGMDKTSASAFSRAGLLFMAVVFCAFRSFSEVGGIMTGRDIVNKHKAFAFHRPSALWISQVIVDQAFAATEILLFSIVVYFIAGLARDVGAFSTFYLLILTMNIAMTLLFRVVGCASPDFDYALKICTVFASVFCLTSGYMVQYRSERAWLRWIFWVNPLGLTFSALMQNEFRRIDMTCTADSLIPSGPGYNDINHQVCTLPGSKPGTAFVAGPDYLADGFSYHPGGLWRNWIIVGIIIVFLLTLNAILGEVVRYGTDSSSLKVYQRPNKEREALNEKLLQKRDRRRRDKSSEAGPEFTFWSESILTWENINYHVPVPGGTQTLLHNVYGYVRPGEITALMGASGAGKTTLLDVLASRKKMGVVTGRVLVDGSVPGKQFQRSTGYAEQLDHHEPTQTVREALRFSADLRQPFKTPIAERHAYVEEIIALLEMETIADCIIGTAQAGLTVEQRKRVTIGIELAAKPELLLFLDEPTSGLDSQSAATMVRFLKKLAAAGQAILCTIHQPNASLFESFDRLLLLQRGGRTVYLGDIGDDAYVLRDYLKRHGAEAGPTDNIAEFMLEAIGAGSSPRVGERDWADMWDESPELEQVKVDIARMAEERRAVARHSASDSAKEYASPTHHQLQVVCRRMFRAYWRSPNYLFTRLFSHLALASITGLSYFSLDDSRSSLQYTVFVVFQATALPVLLTSQVGVMFHMKRDLFFREASSKMYSPWTFATAMIVAEVPCSVLCAIVFFACLYFLPGLDATPSRAGYQFLMILITEVFAVTLGQGLAALTPSPRVAALFEPFNYVIFALFCGVTIPASQMPGFWRAWLYQLDPFTRLIGGMVTTALHGLEVVCTSAEVNRFTAPDNTTCGEYMSPFFERGSPGYLVRNDTQNCEYCAYKVGDEFYKPLGMSFDHRWRELGLYAAFVGSNVMILFAAIRYLNFNRR